MILSSMSEYSLRAVTDNLYLDELNTLRKTDPQLSDILSRSVLKLRVRKYDNEGNKVSFTFYDARAYPNVVEVDNVAATETFGYIQAEAYQQLKNLKEIKYPPTLPRVSASILKYLPNTLQVLQLEFVFVGGKISELFTKFPYLREVHMNVVSGKNSKTTGEYEAIDLDLSAVDLEVLGIKGVLLSTRGQTPIYSVNLIGLPPYLQDLRIGRLHLDPELIWPASVTKLDSDIELISLPPNLQSLRTYIYDGVYPQSITSLDIYANRDRFPKNIPRSLKHLTYSTEDAHQTIDFASLPSDLETLELYTFSHIVNQEMLPKKVTRFTLSLDVDLSGTFDLDQLKTIPIPYNLQLYTNENEPDDPYQLLDKLSTNRNIAHLRFVIHNLGTMKLTVPGNIKKIKIETSSRVPFSVIKFSEGVEEVEIICRREDRLEHMIFPTFPKSLHTLRLNNIFPDIRSLNHQFRELVVESDKKKDE